MLLSVVIVNYNVKFFLEQCLCSVKKALDGSPLLKGDECAEVLVVDNNSTDGSMAYLQPRFPFARFIGNRENTGYARANNQALQLAKGKYVLFLNPDTIVPEDIFQKTMAFMEAHPEAGALGVRMIDGSGKFLQESKRGLPSAWASFCKMAGLTTLFPSSKVFAGYYLGYLDAGKTQPVDVLSGAFLLAFRQVLNSVGGFDERFFMYAEDIDLSYRVLTAGYKNYYLADAVIIHFKGESTRKDARYVQLFYKAMRQFVQKHYQSGSGKIFAGLLNAAVRLRSGVAMLGKKGNGRHAGSLEIKLRDGLSSAHFVGDPDTIGKLKKCKPEFNSGIHSGVQQKNNFIVFCEGKEYSFQQVIASFQTLKQGEKALVHASGSESIAGSFDKNGQGVSLHIPALQVQQPLLSP